ncbi:MAG: HlyD family efflux transporter periplasmic adaptor subunit [Planctomycetaceae bacterium]|nr:HlyD family efflux transporter periplasmic adaptor subunit [Planctomycetales bacterium]MCB9923535.1 HlyD family efflux transporter periplasmic adaptor subunit [Planctomycetaceae bacterium]
MSHRTSYATPGLLVMITLFGVLGCKSETDNELRAKSPRPVSVFKLELTDPNITERVTGVAGSWKTQDLSFEVAGRIQYVVEPETDIEGRLFASQPVAPATAEGATDNAASDAAPTLFTPGTELARIDATRYQLKVSSAEAQIAMITQQRAASMVELEKVIPAERGSATAELRFQDAELARIEPLVRSGAVTRSDFERVQANRDKAQAALAQVDASLAAKQAEIKSLDAQILEAQQSLSDAKRNVAECTIYSPFRGQIATVDAIPGAYVNAGQSVLTVQMMDPIKIELEVSAEQSRRLTYKDPVDVVVSTTGDDQHLGANVYMIDPVADPNTRTFTVTLLMDNEKPETEIPPELAGKPVARTRDIWRLFGNKLPGQDFLMTEVNSIHEDSQGGYVWMITSGPNDNHLLNVKKVRVIPGDVHIPFLDIWTFRAVQIAAGEVFDPQTDRIAGELELPEEMTAGFDGSQILFDRTQWLVKPGDLVAVDLKGSRLPEGYYVPISVISERSGKYYVYAVESGIARRIEVNVFETVNTNRRIEAVNGSALTSGLDLIAKGTHYLVDGEPVLVTGEAR